MWVPQKKSLTGLLVKVIFYTLNLKKKIKKKKNEREREKTLTYAGSQFFQFLILSSVQNLSDFEV